MQVSPYLSFNGQCEEAFRFYTECMNGEQLMMSTYSEGPMASQFPDEMKNKIMHARIKVGQTLLMGSDAPPDRYRKPEGTMICIGTDNAAEAEHIFHSLAEGGQVTMPMAETFWAERFGMLTDRFGVHWLVNCEKSSGRNA